jgi:hypothetical protein
MKRFNVDGTPKRVVMKRFDVDGNGGGGNSLTQWCNVGE